jgi:serine/threonine protein kinase
MCCAVLMRCCVVLLVCLVVAGLGTSLWMSPEMLAREPYTQKADIYSLTLVLWEILTARTPYEQMQNKKELRHEVLHKRNRPPIPPNCHPVYR